VLDLSGQD